jgi:hypothetical protein
MNPWMTLVVFTATVLILMLFRERQQPKGKASRQDDTGPRPITVPPVARAVLQRRRLLPPPLPKPVPKVQPPPLPVAVAVVKVVAPTISPENQTSPLMLELVRLLNSPQSLQAAILLREVLDPPLCRRHQFLGSQGPPPEKS